MKVDINTEASRNTRRHRIAAQDAFDIASNASRRRLRTIRRRLSICQAHNDHLLVGCTVAPGFDFADFVMPDRASLLADFPAHTDLVVALTRRTDSA